MINKYDTVRTLSKLFPTQMAEHQQKVMAYLEKITTVEEKLALEMATRYLIHLNEEARRKEKKKSTDGSSVE